MTVVNPKSISGINSITMASGSDNLLTIHANDTSEKVRVNSSGDVIVGSGVTLSPDGDIFATGITTVSGNVKVGTGITLSPDGDIFFTGIATGNGSGLTNLATDLVNDTSPQLGGDLDTNSHNISLDDAHKINFGDSNDLQIYHSGGENFIRGNASTSPLYIDCCNELQIRHLDTDGSNSEKMILCNDDGAVELYHDNTKQCETSANGLAFPSGKGIDFSATSDSAGSMTSELFSDYEEGTFTLTENGGISLTVYVAEYIRIGRMVHIEVGLAVASNSDGGAIQFSGLPFAVKDTADNTGGLHLVSTNSGRNDLIFAIRGTDDVAVTTNQNLNASRSNYSNKQLKFSGSYTAA